MHYTRHSGRIPNEIYSSHPTWVWRWHYTQRINIHHRKWNILFVPYMVYSDYTLYMAHYSNITWNILYTSPYCIPPMGYKCSDYTLISASPKKYTIRTPDGIVPIIHYTRYTIQIPYEIYYWHRSWRLAVTLHMAHYYTYPKWERLFVPHRA